MRISRGASLIGAGLLLAMAALHGSGTRYLTGRLNESDAAGLLKQVFPVVFAHVSIHLVFLAIFAVVAAFSHGARRPTAWVLIAAILADAALAVYLRAWPPAGALGLAALCFLPAALSRPPSD